MLQFRMTKYDPKLRELDGSYCRDEWTHFAQVGVQTASGLLTLTSYEAVESSYIKVARSFLSEAGIPQLRVRSLEVQPNSKLSPPDPLPVAQLDNVIRSLLREEYWCRLESDYGFIHVGWDFYMYIGVSRPCPASAALAEQLGLFVEEFQSPYLQKK